MNIQYLDRKEGAAYLTGKGLKVSWTTLQKLATVGGGPVYRRFGNRALYLQEDLDAWAQAKISPPQRSTSEAA